MSHSDAPGRDGVETAHADLAEMLSWADGELSPARAAALERHFTECALCIALLEEVRSASACFGDAIRILDAPVPAGSVSEARRRAVWWKRRRAVSTVAAVLLLLTGASYALAQSARMRAWLGRWTRREQVPPAAYTAPASGATLLSVIAPDSLDILVGERPDSLNLRVVRSSRRRLSVETGSTTPPVRVELGIGRLRVEPDTIHNLTLVIPLGTRARIISAGGVVLDLPRVLPGSGTRADSIVMLRLPPTKGL